jgi:hypothetical protein
MDPFALEVHRPVLAENPSAGLPELRVDRFWPKKQYGGDPARPSRVPALSAPDTVI